MSRREPRAVVDGRVSAEAEAKVADDEIDIDDHVHELVDDHAVLEDHLVDVNSASADIDVDAADCRREDDADVDHDCDWIQC